MDFEQLVYNYRENRYQRKLALDYLRQMKKYAKSTNDNLAYGRYLYFEAENHYFNNNLEKCHIYLQKAHILLIQFPTSIELISCLNLFGILADLRSDYSQSMEYYYRALNLGQSIDSTKQVMIVLNNIGNLFLTMNAYQEAIDYYRRCLKLCSQLSKSQTIDLETTFRQNLTTAYVYAGNLKQAQNQLHKLEAINNTKFRCEKVFIINYLNSMILCQGDNHVAIKANSQAIIESLDENLPLECVRMLIEIFDLWLSKQLYSLVKISLDYIYVMLEKDNFQHFYKEYTYALFKYYRAIDDQPNYHQAAVDYINLTEQQSKQDVANKLLSLKDKLALFKTTEQLQQSQEKSITDQLTGLYNRHILNGFLEKRFEQAKSAQSSIGLIILDIDYFKTYNDYHGHVNGDRCLQDIGNIIKQQTCDDIIAMRYGGDEFVIMLFDRPQNEIMHIAENIKHQVKTLNCFVDATNSTTVTVSHGIYMAKPYLDETIFDYILKADKSLYRAKLAKDTIVLD